MKPNIAFVGLGAMGLPMAQALIAADYQVRAFDLNAQAMEHFHSSGGTPASSAQTAAQNANILILMVVNAQQVDDVLFRQDAVSALAEKAVVVVSSTIAPDYAATLGPQLSSLGHQLIDAPVSGGVKGAEEKTLSIMASGAEQAYAEVEAILKTMGSSIFYLGERNGQGSAMKIVNQLLAGVHLATAAEAVTLANNYGLDMTLVQEIIGRSAGHSWMFQDRVARMLQDQPQVKSAVDIFVKDLGIVSDVAQAAKLPVPLAAAALQLFTMASAKGYGQEDDSQVIKVLHKESS